MEKYLTCISLKFQTNQTTFYEVKIFSESSYKSKKKYLTKLDEIGLFQFLSNFTKIAMISLIEKLNKCVAPLWKAMKITFFRHTKFVTKCEKSNEICASNLVSFFFR